MLKTVLSALAATLALAAIPAAQEKPVAEIETLKKAATTAWEDQNWPEAAKAYAALVKVDPNNGTAWHHLGYALHVQGRLDEALPAHLKAYESSRMKGVGAYNAACVYALKKNKDEAFAWLDKAAAAGFADPDQIEGDSDMDSLRDDPRFAKFLEKVKSSGGGGGGGIQAFAGSSPRGSSRIAYFGGGKSHGQVCVDFGRAKWKDSYTKEAGDSKMVGRRWRLGADFWTRLETQIDVTIGTARLSPGEYYLTLEKNAEGAYLLTFLDAAGIRGLRMDPFMAHKTTGGTQTALTHATAADAIQELDIKLVLSEIDDTVATFEIRFGPHRLSAPVSLKLASQ